MSLLLLKIRNTKKKESCSNFKESKTCLKFTGCRQRLPLSAQSITCKRSRSERCKTWQASSGIRVHQRTKISSTSFLSKTHLPWIQNKTNSYKGRDLWKVELKLIPIHAFSQLSRNRGSSQGIFTTIFTMSNRSMKISQERISLRSSLSSPRCTVQSLYSPSRSLRKNFRLKFYPKNCQIQQSDFQIISKRCRNKV